MWRRDPTPDEIREWVEGTQDLLKGVEVGRSYVYLDGFVLPMDSEAVAFEGWAARHNLPHLPQTEAMVDRSVLDRTLGDRGYWRSRWIDE
jgi:hypothetical protein